MRCKICDQLLNEWESVHKDPETGEYTDTCGYCRAMSKSYNIDQLEDEDGVLYDLELSDLSSNLVE